MKKYAGEEFLNRLYKDLVHSEEVVHTAKGANKNEDLAIYLERLERITNEARDKDRLDLLKHFYYKKYVINEEEVPESYFENLEQIALERGYGHIKYDDNTKKEEINSIISEQKETLDKWLEYFVSDDTKHYPMWFKYYVFQNVMKIGYFDKEKNEFTKRTSSTVKPFIEINREAIAMLYDELYKYLDKQDLTDEQLEQLIKNGSFNKIYSYIIRKLDEVKKINSTSNEGVWKKYNQGSDPEILFNDIHGKGTGWCTAGGLETATSHLEGGDFHVYYTKNEKGEYTNPRIAIRMEARKIAEIRGISGNQNLENEMECVVEEKLQEFPDKDEYKKKVSDMKKLTEIYKKDSNNKELTKEELKFLYEIDSQIIGFGYGKDPRILEIINHRNRKKDLAFIFNLQEKEISLTNKEALEKKKKLHYGPLYFYEFKKNMDLPAHVIGNVNFSNLMYVNNRKLPERIDGFLNLSGLISAEGLVLPKTINGYLDLNSLTNASDIVFPKEIKGSLDLKKLKYAAGVVLPEYVGGSLYLGSLSTAEGLVLPKTVNGNLYLNGLQSTKGLVLPEKLNGGLYLTNLINAEGLVLPEKINGILQLERIKTIENLVFPKEIDGEVWLSNLESVNNVVFPEKIPDLLYMRKLVSAKNVVFPKEMAKNLTLDYLEVAQNVKFLHNGSIILNSLKVFENLQFPQKLNGHLGLEKIKNADDIVFPEIIEGSLLLGSVTSADDLILPKCINGNLDLTYLKEAKNIHFPKLVGGSLFLDKLEEAESLLLPEIVSEDLILSSLTSAKGLILPKKVGRILNLENLFNIEGILLPKNEQGEFYVPGDKVVFCRFTNEELIEAAKRTEARQQEPKIFEEIDDLSTGNPKK